MRSFSILARIFSLSLIAPTLIACSDDSTSGTDPEPLEDSLEIYSWWTGSGEAQALEALLDVYRDKHPNVEVTNAAALDPTNARTELADRLEAGEPPDSFQAISGVDMIAHVEADRMESITDLAEENGWIDSIPQAVLDTLSVDGELYAVPVNIERDNNLYFNQAVLDAHGITDPPGTLDQFYAMCDTLQAADPPVYPLALPPAGWVLALVAFETLMPGVNGGAFYNKFFKGEAQLAEGSPDREQLVNLFTEFYKVAQCSNVADGGSDPNFPRWDLQGDFVYDGEAASIVMGDWMKGYLEGGKTWEGDARDAWEPGENFGVVAGLNSGDHFTFNSAVFGLPQGAPHPRAAEAFLNVVASADGQAAFNPLKGSVPARTGTNLDGFDAMVRAAAEDFEEAGGTENMLLAGYASLTTLTFQLAINPALVVFTVGGRNHVRRG
jgi:glucose/mannose transport system substrate-binding protein